MSEDQTDRGNANRKSRVMRVNLVAINASVGQTMAIKLITRSLRGLGDFADGN